MNENMKKMMKAVLMGTVLFVSLYYGKQYLNEYLVQNELFKGLIDLSNQLDTRMMIIISIGISFLWMVFSWNKKVLSENEILKVKYEYLYNHKFTSEDKKELKVLENDEDVSRFMKSYLNLLTAEEKYVIDQACQKKIEPKYPFAILWTKRVVKFAMVAMLAINSETIYTSLLQYSQEQQALRETLRIEKEKEQQLNNSLGIGYAENEEITRKKKTFVTDQTFYLEGLPPIVLSCDNNASEYYVELILNTIKAQPQWLLNNCTQINIQNAHYFNDTSGIGAVGYAHYPANTIDLLYYPEIDGYMEYNIESTVIHELGHIWDYAHGHISESEQFVNIYNQYANQLYINEINTEYAATDSGEFFAEYMVAYVEYPNELSTKAPELYNFFAGL